VQRIGGGRGELIGGPCRPCATKGDAMAECAVWAREADDLVPTICNYPIFIRQRKLQWAIGARATDGKRSLRFSAALKAAINHALSDEIPAHDRSISERHRVRLSLTFCSGLITL